MADLFAHIGDKNPKLFRQQDFVPALLLINLCLLSRNRLVSQNILHLVLFALFIPPLLFSFWRRFRDLRVNQAWMLAVLIPPFLLGLALWEHWRLLTVLSLFGVFTMMIVVSRLGPQSPIAAGKDGDSGDPQT
jgi:uncharacterized membrane protein YhaH (DUF805 family)